MQEPAEVCCVGVVCSGGALAWGAPGLAIDRHLSDEEKVEKAQHAIESGGACAPLF